MPGSCTGAFKEELRTCQGQPVCCLASGPRVGWLVRGEGFKARPVGIGMESSSGLELNTRHLSHAINYRESSKGSLRCELGYTREHAQGTVETTAAKDCQCQAVGRRCEDREYVGASVGVQDGRSVGDSVGSAQSATADVQMCLYQS